MYIPILGTKVGVSFLADFDPIKYALSRSASLGLGFDFSFQSILGHCV